MQRAVFTIFAVLAICGGVGADQGRTEIGPTETFPIVIDTPGSYVLTADLHVTSTGTNAIEITADNVDLDLGGHVIRGPGMSTVLAYGVSAVGVIGGTVHDGAISEFNSGIYLGSQYALPRTGGNRLFNLTVGDCARAGVVLKGGTARDVVVHNTGLVTSHEGFVCEVCSISNVTVRGSWRGFQISFGTAENSLAEDNQEIGFDVIATTLIGCTSASNGDIGIYAAYGSVVTSCSVVENGGYGIRLDSNQNCNVVNSTGRNNAGGNITGCDSGNGCHQNYLP